MSISWLLLGTLAAAPFALALGAAADTSSDLAVKGAAAHENLKVFFVRGRSAPGPVPLTLAEALEKERVIVHETGNVNELRIENLGTEDVFVQAGDIVKGGQQDRVLTVSLLLPAKSGQVAIGAFCVEQGRWAARGTENVRRFSSAAQAMPSREAKLAMMAPAKPAAAGPPAGLRPVEPRPVTGSVAREQRVVRSGEATGGSRQGEVWRNVGEIQAALSGSLNDRIAGSASPSSLQLSLENEKLGKERTGYATTLRPEGLADDDIVGVVIAINGRLSSADVYASNGLFRKMWGKIIDAAATEAIGKRKAKVEASAEPLDEAAAKAFLVAAQAAPAAETTSLPVPGPVMVREARDTDKSLYVETKRAASAAATATVGAAMVLHRSILAK